MNTLLSIIYFILLIVTKFIHIYIYCDGFIFIGFSDDILDSRALRLAALAQLNNSPNIQQISPELLQNRLEVRIIILYHGRYFIDNIIILYFVSNMYDILMICML